RLLAAKATASLKAGDLAAAERFALDGIERTEPNSEPRAALQNVRGVIASVRGELQAAAHHFEESLATRTRLGRKEAMSRTVHNLGTVYVELGQYGRAVPRFEEALTLAEHTGDVRAAAETAASLAGCRLALGEHDRAHEGLRKSLALSERVGAPAAIAGALIRLARYDTERGYYTEAEQRLARSRSLIHRLATGAPEAVMQRQAEGRLLTELGAFDEAAELLEEALTISRDQGSPREVAETLRALGQLASTQREAKAAADRFAEAASIYAQLENETAATLASAERARALLQANAGEAAQAIAEKLAPLEARLRARRLVLPLRQLEAELKVSFLEASAPQRAGAAVLALEEARRAARADRRPEAVWRLDAEIGRIYALGGVRDRSRKAFVRAMEQVRALFERVPEQRRPSYLNSPDRAQLRSDFQSGQS
ncbi:MAG: tetratricopeptide repeat protein, partial [Planctomycetota bacterium]